MTEVAQVKAALDEGHDLVSSARVEGTPVFSPEGEKLGTVHSVMIHKVTGQVAYAVLQFGGLFGIGSHVHPIPWDRMTYDKARRGYVTVISREQIEDAPSLDLDETDRIRESETPMYSYWDSKPYW
ncbi:PRC-barrel domain-containing protein [Sphingomonas sp. KC8]|uniref:PRC-barrel domain-containing protein n=1 Tax=Sphingomonas sp. KC8 TaxID=1030157 RepID=UPI0002DA11AD|nr:PRC-barrel domain-containing protein [Sphingomonas sp. KC8]ARS29188.1 PRC-barrel domain-containing protein [Sphingomonas sp. KC8]